MKNALAAVVLLLQGCTVGYMDDPYAQNAPPPPAQPRPRTYQSAPAPPPPAPTYQPPPPAPYQQPPRRLSRDEAVQRAYEIASQHGLQPVGVRKAERDDHRWKVEVSLAGGGEAKIEIDPWSADELRFKVKKHRRHHRDEDEDDDD